MFWRQSTLPIYLYNLSLLLSELKNTFSYKLYVLYCTLHLWFVQFNIINSKINELTSNLKLIFFLNDVIHISGKSIRENVQIFSKVCQKLNFNYVENCAAVCSVLTKNAYKDKKLLRRLYCTTPVKQCSLVVFTLSCWQYGV